MSVVALVAALRPDIVTADPPAGAAEQSCVRSTATGAEAVRHVPVTAIAGGLRAYIDPQTGELTSEPIPISPGDTLDTAESVLQRSSEGVYGPFETPAPGGGVMVVLDGRSRMKSGVIATEDACLDDPQ